MICTQKKYNRDILTLTVDAKEALTSYHWPGNIRELSHLMERAFLLSNSSALNADNLGLTSKTDNHLVSAIKSKEDIPLMTLETAEKKLIKQALAQEDHHVAKAAKLLGLTKSSLYRRLEKYDLFSK